MSDLASRSVRIILESQASSGAYPACPVFPTYHYSWFRDGAFIAYAMDLVGEHDSAKRFHEWAAATIVSRAELVERAVVKARSGNRPAPGTCCTLDARSMANPPTAAIGPTFNLTDLVPGFGRSAST